MTKREKRKRGEQHLSGSSRRSEGRFFLFPTRARWGPRRGVDAATHPSFGTLRSTLKLKVVSVGSTVHFDWPLPTSSDVSLVFVYLRNDPRRGRSVSRTRRGRRSEDLATEARPRGRVWTRRGVAGEGGGGDARVRRLDEVVRVLDVGRLDGEVLDQHGGVSSPVRARGAPGRRRRVTDGSGRRGGAGGGTLERARSGSGGARLAAANRARRRDAPTSDAARTGGWRWRTCRGE